MCDQWQLVRNHRLRTWDDSGAAVAGTDATATGSQAVFTNNYSKDPRAVTFSVTKNYTENGYPYQAGMFSTKLTAIGSYATASGAKSTVAELPNNADSVPMPTGSSMGSMDADFDDFRTASFPRISFDGGTGNNTYVYKITENSGTVADATAMTYDSTEYYVFVAITVTKELHNRNADTTRNLYAGEFTFTISGDDEASTQRISAGTFASDRKFFNGYAVGSEAQSATEYGNAVSGMTKLSNLVFNESDVGKTYRFVVKELAQHTNPNTGAVNTKLDSDSTKLTGETATDVKIDDASASAPLYKQLSGRDWSDSEKDRFTFTVEKCNYSTNAGSFSDASSIVRTSDSITLSTLPLPSRSSSVTVGKDQVVLTKAGDFAKIGFGSFSFSKPGTYVYKVTEVAGDDTTLTYAANVRYLRFRVEENQMKGVYSVIVTTFGYDAPTATDANDGAAFVNVCKSVERLPLTGGLTTRNFLAGGFVVGLLAVFAGLGIHAWWNKQRRKEQLLE